MDTSRTSASAASRSRRGARSSSSASGHGGHRHDLGRRDRPGRAAVAVRLRGRRRKRVDLIRNGVASAVVYDAATGARAGTGSTGPRAAGAEPHRAVPAEHGHGARHDATRRADRRDRARPARHALPLHQPGPPEDGDPHRDDPRRHVPRRGRQAHPSGAELPLHAGDSRGLQRRPRREPRDEAAPRRVLRRRARSGARISARSTSPARPSAEGAG